MRLSTKQLEELRRTGVLRMSEEKGYQKEQKNNQEKTELKFLFTDNLSPLYIKGNLLEIMLKMTNGQPFIVDSEGDKFIINPNGVKYIKEGWD